MAVWRTKDAQQSLALTVRTGRKPTTVRFTAQPSIEATQTEFPVFRSHAKATTPCARCGHPLDARHSRYDTMCKAYVITCPACQTSRAYRVQYIVDEGKGS